MSTAPKKAVSPASKTEYCTIEQAYERLCGTTPINTLRYWISMGKVRACKPGKKILIDVASLDALLESTAVGPTSKVG